MPTTSVRNILVGAGHLYISATDTTQALPTAPTATPPALPASYTTALDTAAETWRYMGATSGGVEVGYTPETTDIEVDQLKDAAIVFNTGQSMTVSTTLAEATLANLLVTWGFRASDLTTDTLNLPAAPDGLVERSIAIVGNAPKTAATGSGSKRERVYYGRRVVNVDGGTHTMSRTDMVGFPVSFRLLGDPASVGSEYGQIIDRSIA